MPNNMNINPPAVGSAGPAWAEDINEILTTTIANHNHVGPNGGTPLTQDALAIDGDLSLNGNALTATEKVVLATQATAVGTTASVYNLNGNLYYKNGSGNNIQITDATGLAANSVDGISGLAGSDGGASYSAGQFIWTSNNGLQYALMNMGAINLYNYTQTNPTFRTSIVQPNVITANKVYQLGPTNLYFPASLPTTTSVMTISSAGVLASGVSVPSYVGSTNLAASVFTDNSGNGTSLGSLVATGDGNPFQISITPKVNSDFYLECKTTSGGHTADPISPVIFITVAGSGGTRFYQYFYRTYDPSSANSGVWISPGINFVFTPNDEAEAQAGLTITVRGYISTAEDAYSNVTLNNAVLSVRELIN